MKRHIDREKAMICIYQVLLVNRDVKTVIEDIFLTKYDEVDEFPKLLVTHSIQNKDRFIEYINNVLDNWKFSRLSFVDQSILLLACAEFDKKLEVPAVIINEAILLSKKYSDEDAYKIINGVLDKI
ncbi:MAG: transcription antitermination factor NusB [Anaerorhabdus sp.]